MAKTYRRFIRIDGGIVTSPRFPKKKEADDWYDQMKTKKGFAKFGLKSRVSKSHIPTLFEYSAEWMLMRQRDHGANTWRGDERRLRNHVLPVLGDLRLDQVNPTQIRDFLTSLTFEKVTKDESKTVAVSISTRNKVKALISGIFQSAVDQDPPLIPFNPVRAVRFKSGRKSQGAKLPTKILDTEDAVLKFMNAAKEQLLNVKPTSALVAGRSYVYAALSLMTGPRKSELLALRWNEVDLANRTITFAWIYEQESKTLLKRTKKGADEERLVPISDELLEILFWWKSVTPYSKPVDFVLSKPGGGNMGVSTLRQMHNRICQKADVNVSPHGLRHSFGRFFVQRTGNLKALQEILGHSSISTTEIYSRLNAGHLQQFRDSMGTKKKAQKRVKGNDE